MAAENTFSKLRTYWFTPVNNSPLITFRILFGVIMFMEFSGSLTSGWVKEVYIEAPYRFTFIGFEFLQNMQGPVMYIYFLIAAIISLLVITGLFYRPASILLALMWTAVYFSQKSHYNNHYYLMVLISWMMTLMPANRRASVDVKWKLAKPTNECYRWQIHIFIIQIAIVYTYASIAKMYPDWLNAVPVKLWFSRRAGTPYIGHLFGSEWFAYFISYSGILFDLVIVPALLWKRTRILAVVAMLLFHFFNGSVFGIGVFPYLAMSLNVFFFPGKTFDNVLGVSTLPFRYKIPAIKTQNTIIVILLVYILWQVLTPLRHHLYKGDVTWTEEGHRMSWRMMLRTKSGRVLFKVKDKNSDSVWIVRPREYLLRYQASDVACKPDFIWQFSQLLKSKYKEKGFDVAVYAESYCSLNGREEKLMVDPNRDITIEEWKPFCHHDWITTKYK